MKKQIQKNNTSTEYVVIAGTLFRVITKRKNIHE